MKMLFVSVGILIEREMNRKGEQLNELQIFKNSDFGEIRTVTVNDEPMFCLADVCRALELTQTSKVKDRLNSEGVNSIPTLTNGGTQNLLYINESNLYKTIFQSRKKSAERFTDWVTGEVLPSIRKTGSYQKPLTQSEQIKLIAQGYTELEEKVTSIDTDLKEFKETLPLLAVDCEVITNAVRKRAIEFLGGKKSNAYNDKNLRGRVYADLHREVKHQFGVSTYKAIRRNQVEKAIGFIENYEAPYVLKEEIQNCNAKISIGGI